MSDKEIELTKGISNETVCNYFLAFFILVSILAGGSFLYVVWVASRVKGSIGAPLVLQSLVSVALAIANSLFLYVMCARSLLK
jgi:hypothetical protein